MTDERLNKLVIHLSSGKPVAEEWLVEKLGLSVGDISEFVEQGYLARRVGKDTPRYSLTEKGKK